MCCALKGELKGYFREKIGIFAMRKRRVTHTDHWSSEGERIIANRRIICFKINVIFHFISNAVEYERYGHFAFFLLFYLDIVFEATNTNYR